ncbi:MAG: hypothetical protein H6779_03675 [Candidatus Nomurabacteria bacterium]|nr:MAG: hypothetical protein H6779_03675 [Candidatus Nomurabacteria bacterium]
MWGYFFVAATAVQISYAVFHLGLVLLMVLMIKNIKKKPVSASAAESSPMFVKISNVTISIAVLLLIYFLGLVSPLAKMTGSQSLCSLVYHTHVKTECLTENSINIKDSVYKTEAGNFGVIVDDEMIGDIEVVGDKIVYTLVEREMGNTVVSVVYDGKVLGEYEAVYRLTDLDGKLAYLIENKTGSRSPYTLFYDGEKYMDLNKDVYDLTNINGKVAFKVYDMNNPYVYFDGKNYNNNYVYVDLLIAYSGQPAFVGKRDSQYYIAIGDQEFGPYSGMGTLDEKDGHLFSLIINNGDLQAFVDGQVGWIGKKYNDDKITSFANNSSLGKVRRIVDLIDGQLSTVVSKNGKGVLVVGDQEVTEVASYDSGPYIIDGKLGYLALNSDGSSQFMIDDQMVPNNIFNEPVYDVAVSKSGKIAVQTKDKNDVIRVYVDGQIVYEGGASINSIQKGINFVGDKLLFSITGSDGVSDLWYNNAIIKGNYLNFKQTIALNDKLLIFAEKKDGKGIILLEQ